MSISEDNILEAFHTAKNDSAKALAADNLASIYNDINMDSALYFGHVARSLAIGLKWTEREASASLGIGYTHMIMTNYDSAFHYIDLSYNRYKKNKDSLGIANVYASYGRTYASENELSKGLDYYFKALDIYQRFDAKENMLSTYSDIGELYNRVGEKERSMLYFQKAIELNEEVGDEIEAAYLMLSVGSGWLEKEELDSAMYYFNQAKDLYIKNDVDFYVRLTTDMQGEVYLLKREYNKAMKAFLFSIGYYISTNDKESIASGYITIGKTHLAVALDTTGFVVDPEVMPKSKRKNLKLAIENFEKAKRIYEEELNSMISLGEVYELLSLAKQEGNDPKGALSYYKKYMTIKDSLDIQNEAKKVVEFDADREMTLKNKELELQQVLIAKKRNERLLLLAGMVILIVGLIVVLMSHRARGRANKLLAVEKEKSEELLLNILPEEVAHELKEKGSANAMHFDEVSVLFTDFVDFTKAGERLTSQELVDELHTCFKAFDEITGKYHIEKIKTIGDAYLAVSGLPAADAKHAEQVVNAAIEILAFMEERQALVGDKTFRIRIGVHSGDVVAGIVGVKKFAYDIWGDTVNTASRIEHHSEPNKINISQTTYELVKDKFSFTYRGELEAKNKGKLKMYFVEV